MLGEFVELNNSVKCPQLGFGTFMSAGSECYEAVKVAIDAGYRHIDTAFLYFNEDQVGRAIEEKIKEGKVTRKELFVTTKLWTTAWEDVEGALRESLRKLKLDYVDLYLIHNPCGVQAPPGGISSFEDYLKLNEKMKSLKPDEKYSKMNYVEVWREMEKLVDLELTRSVGVSNMNKFQINKLVTNCRIKPVMNQVEVHPWHLQNDLVSTCENHGILITAYGPMGAPGRPPTQGAGLPVLMEDPVILALANEYKKTPAQILIRFAIQRGIIPIPKSGKAERIRQNGNVFDFHICTADMMKLFAINRNQRFFPLSFHDHRFYPFQEPYVE